MAKILKPKKENKHGVSSLENHIESDVIAPLDRMQMEMQSDLSQSNQPSSAQMMPRLSFPSMSYNDTCIVSKEFAEKHQICGEGGIMRPLMKDDVISDMNGVKCTISVVSSDSRLFRANALADSINMDADYSMEYGS